MVHWQTTWQTGTHYQCWFFWLACVHLNPLHEHPPCPPPAFSNHSLPPSSQGTASFGQMRFVASSERRRLFSPSTRWCEVEFSDHCWTDISQPLVVHHQSGPGPGATISALCLLSPFWFAPGQLLDFLLQAQPFLRLFTSQKNCLWPSLFSEARIRTLCVRNSFMPMTWALFNPWRIHLPPGTDAVTLNSHLWML